MGTVLTFIASTLPQSNKIGYFNVCVEPSTSTQCKKERDVASWYERSLMVRWVVGSIPHGIHIELFLHDWCNKGRGMWYVGWCI